MAHSYTAPGLEVDGRIQENAEKLPHTGDASLEHAGGPAPLYPPQQAWAPATTATYSGSPSEYSKTVAGKPERRRVGLGGAVLCLSVALAIVLILAVVAAGVGGSLAASRKTKLSSCNANNEALQQKLSSNSSLSAANFGNNNNSSSDSCNTSTSNSSTCEACLAAKPTSDCSKLPSTFTAYDSSTYNITCNQDLNTNNLGPDIIGVLVHSLKDCITACSVFNNNGLATNGTCYAVAVNWNIDPSKGNCWLKGISDISSEPVQGVDSAVVTHFAYGKPT